MSQDFLPNILVFYTFSYLQRSDLFKRSVLYFILFESVLNSTFFFLENLSSEYANDLDVLKDENQKLKKQVLSLNETVEMLKEKVKIKENVANGLDQKVKK